MIALANRAVLAIPEWLDARASPTAITLAVLPILMLLMLPTGLPTPNEEYYFQVAERFWRPERFGEYSAIFAPSYHLILSNIFIGLPTVLFGYEIGNAVLRIVTAAALAAGLGALFSAWKASALEAVIVVTVFALLGQDLFGGEWLFLSVEGKVFAYVLVFFGLALAFRDRYTPAVCCAAAATYFHIHVGGFWMLVVLLWMWRRNAGWSRVGKAFAGYTVAVLPLLAAILLQRGGETLGVSDPRAVALQIERIAHHIAPFSNQFILWDWSLGIVLAGGLLLALGVVAPLSTEPSAKDLNFVVRVLIAYLFVMLLVSATDVGVRVLRSFLVFRPASLTLLLALLALSLAIRGMSARKTLMLGITCVLLPAAVWRIAQAKIEEVLLDPDPATRQDIAEVAAAAREATTPDQIVLVHPAHDGGKVERQLSRRAERPTLVNYRFVPSVPRFSQEWLRRLDYRAAVFETGCRSADAYPIGVLVVRNIDLDPVVLESCGPVVWRGATHSIVSVETR